LRPERIRKEESVFNDADVGDDNIVG